LFSLAIGHFNFVYLFQMKILINFKNNFSLFFFRNAKLFHFYFVKVIDIQLVIGGLQFQIELCGIFIVFVFREPRNTKNRNKFSFRGVIFKGI
jgi:hypothetical protein